ncbi:MAG TPA: hypothetical protein VIZ65_16910 [Cellvibrionaceae bacterium]
MPEIKITPISTVTSGGHNATLTGVCREGGIGFVMGRIENEDADFLWNCDGVVRAAPADINLRKSAEPEIERLLDAVHRFTSYLL